MSAPAILALILWVYMTGWFVIATLLKRNDVADVAWGLGFILLSWSAYVIAPAPSLTALMVNLLVTVWGVRLATHIAQRLRNTPEDARYRAWRTSWTHVHLRSYLQIFMLQGALLALIASPILFVNLHGGEDYSFFAILGILVWITGFTFEGVADRQLAAFRAHPPEGKTVLDTGLWRYSRHPNYFGEVLLWWGLYVVACATPGGWVTIIGPLTITTLILFVSGIPLLEKRYAGDAAFAEYKARTSAFIPLPPRGR